MTDRGRRLGKGIAIALAVHIVAAALLGILGYRFTQRPPQILEVTLGGGGKGSAAAEKGTAETAASAATVQQQKQQSAPVRTDDIVDRKQKPQTQQQEQPRQPQSSSTSSEAAQSNVKSGEAGGTGIGGGEGTGAGTGQGSGYWQWFWKRQRQWGRSGKRQRCSGNTAVFSIQYGSSLSSCRQKSRDRGYCLCKNACKFGRQC